ncbi:hypothetical protein [Kineococcus xinjiangensis]|uniref:hypothetical protein n=1 Tax=Kineococcus xinjiangensis TaxID=512762 RepID=UPI0013049CA4|nr:hypothetical protein [Kineococcus xinjiangensis]
MDVDWTEWPHVCAVCGQLLHPTLTSTGRPTQWLHGQVHVDHMTVPLLLAPADLAR